MQHQHSPRVSFAPLQQAVGYGPECNKEYLTDKLLETYHAYEFLG